MTKALMEASLWSLPANAENSAEKTRTVCSANTASGTTPHRDSNRNTPTGYPPADTQVERPDDPLGQIGVGSTYLSDSGVWPIRVQVPADTSQNCTRVHPPFISASPGVFY